MPIWFGLTWAELRRETKDQTMNPLGHALLTLVPGLNVTLVWRHFKAINAFLERTGVPIRLDPMSGAIGVIIWWLTFTHYASDPVFLALDAIELAAGTAVVIYGQRALNAAWASGGAEERLLETDLMALAVAGTYGLFTIVGFLSASS